MWGGGDAGFAARGSLCTKIRVNSKHNFYALSGQVACSRYDAERFRISPRTGEAGRDGTGPAVCALLWFPPQVTDTDACGLAGGRAPRRGGPGVRSASREPDTTVAVNSFA